MQLIDSPSDYPPYSTSTPERTDFLYYSSKDENNPLFSPLSFTNSSSSSINESTMFSQPMMIAANNSQDSGLCYQTFIEFADDISDQCAQLLQIEANIDQEDINKVLKHVKILIQTCDAPDTKKMTLENQWEHISEAFNKATEMDSIKFQVSFM
jgi:hypothetical protein